MDILYRTDTLLHLHDRPWLVWLGGGLTLLVLLGLIPRLLQLEDRLRRVKVLAAFLGSLPFFLYFSSVHHVVADKSTGQLSRYETWWWSSEPRRVQRFALDTIQDIRVERDRKRRDVITLVFDSGRSHTLHTCSRLSAGESAAQVLRDFIEESHSRR